MIALTGEAKVRAAARATDDAVSAIQRAVNTLTADADLRVNQQGCFKTPMFGAQTLRGVADSLNAAVAKLELASAQWPEREDYEQV